MSENLEKTEKNLRDLIETLRDGHQGFIELEKNLKDPEARKLFREETLVRASSLRNSRTNCITSGSRM